MSIQSLAQRLASPTRFGTLAAISAATLMGLSACEQRTYPSPSAEPPPPPPPPAQLMGAPDNAPTYAPPPPPAYAPPPPYAQPYDSGAIVAMAPIPNPGDPGGEPYYGDRYQHGRVHDRYYASGVAVAPTPFHHHRWASYAAASKARPVYSAKVAPKPVVAAAKPAPTHKTLAMTAAGAAVGLAAPHVGTPYPATVAKGSAAKTTTTTTTTASGKTTATGDKATDTANLQTTLTDAIGKTAVLTVPATFAANQPADVTLTIPAGFADTLRDAAKTDDLSDAASSAELTALLSGDGYAALPADAQVQPLTTGQATTFRWTVTAQPNAKGPLHADVAANLLGGGSTPLALGTVQNTGDKQSKTTSRVVGASLLVLIGVLVVAWLSRRRAAPDTRRPVASQTGRPLDMNTPRE